MPKRNNRIQCKECGSIVRWVKDAGTWKCLNADGTDHWDLCSKLKFERIRRTGEHFKTEDAEGYLTPFKRSGVAFVHLRAKPRPPRQLVLEGIAGCGQCVPPWESPCPDCPARIAA